MVVNLCLPPFHTTIHCNKLCADGYDVTNLVSADPAVRRRGFKLEYFLRPPLQVTLTFDFKVELCRVDIELWPWGMDRGQAGKKIEISTCSDSPSSCCEQTQQKKNQESSQRKNSHSTQNNGHMWSVQAQGWSEEPQREAQSSTYLSDRQPANPEFKLVGRCELKEETKVCFSHTHFRPRPPFHQPPPPASSNCRHDTLWSRGVQSLSAVTQLRVALPFGGAGSALGLKALSVWGQPARCCPAEKVEEIKHAFETSERPTPRPVSVPPVRPERVPKKTSSQSFSVPEEFLDPITQEVMVLPMLLPSGVSVDHSTLEEYQKREATWGRQPNDPFTGVPFTASSQPLPNPQLKSRIDHFLLQSGHLGKDGRLGRQEEGANPHPSRLVASEVDGGTNTDRTDISALNCEQTRKRDLKLSSNDAPEDGQISRAKRARNYQALEAACSSHEQRLSVSLDEALSSALQGRPSFTSNLSLNTQLGTDSLQLKQTPRTEATSSSAKSSCSACSRSVSVYAAFSSPIYRLQCGHFLCRSCLERPSESLTSGHVCCHVCHSSTPSSNVIRVHH